MSDTFNFDQFITMYLFFIWNKGITPDVTKYLKNDSPDIHYYRNLGWIDIGSHILQAGG